VNGCWPKRRHQDRARATGDLPILALDRFKIWQVFNNAVNAVKFSSRTTARRTRARKRRRHHRRA